MPISLDKEKPLTERQKEIVDGIKKGMQEEKSISRIAKELGISESYLNELKKKGGLTKKGSEVMDWIEKHDKVKDWLREIKGGEAHKNTKRQFAGALKKYCEFRGLSPAELLDEGEQDLKLERDDKVVKAHILDFKDSLRDSGKGKNTIALYISVIRSFFASHEVPLPKLSNGTVEVEWEKEEFDKEKVKELVNVCSPREKAIFLTMFQSGLAANEVSSLRVGDLREEKDGITVLRLKREKNGFKFVTFLGRDAREAIDQYLKVRNEGNLIPSKPNISREARVKTDDDFLFATYDNREKKWNRIEGSHIPKYMKIACKKLGWYQGEKINPWRPHALRASFASILLNNGVPKTFVDFMLAHKQNGTDSAYFKTHFDTLFKYYKDNEHLLSISELEKIPDSKYEEIMIELHKRNGTIKELKEKMAAMEVREEARETSLQKIKNAEEEGLMDVLNDPETVAFLMKKMKEKFK